MNKIRFAIVAALAAAALTLQAQNLINNGGFESGPVGTNAPIPSWTRIDTVDVSAVGGTPIGTDFWLARDIPASPDGGQFALLRNSTAPNPAEGLRQDVPGLIPGLEYTLSFWLANGGLDDFRDGRPDQVGPGHIDVTFGSVTRSSPTVTFQGFGLQTWQPVTFNFVAGQSTETLILQAAGFIGGGAENIGRIAVDGVVLVPEPSAIALVSLAALAFGLRFFRRR